jgi:predicted NBD/HSP70 family sugar kinase
MMLAPPLDPEFRPAALYSREHRRLADEDPTAREVHFALVRPDGTVFREETRLLGERHARVALSLRHAERWLKFLLWQKGASRVLVAGAPDVVVYLKTHYGPTGPRAFDHAFMGDKVYGERLRIEAVATAVDLPAAAAKNLSLGRHLSGCRIGFDLGGSDRKAAAVIDGRVVFSEEVPWDPYFQTDPAYHLEGVHDSLLRAAAHLPRVDAIGGSAAGVYVNNEVRVASLFRGVAPADFERHVRRMFLTLQQRWNGVPFEVTNDGEVTALAASLSLGVNRVLGISMGTSLAAGYVTAEGSITPWLNELAFAPIDFREDAPLDEWSGDGGCGVQYFSQQGVGRLAARAGFCFPKETGWAERLIHVQDELARGSIKAGEIFETVGICFGYAVAHYADFYDISHVLILGRVTSGMGAEIILDRARAVLAIEFPELADRISFHTPNEQNKRHGQAVTAASLPALRSSLVD